MRKWTALLALLLLVSLTAPAIAKPPEGKGPALKESCQDIVENYGAIWNLATFNGTSSTADAPACFDLPERQGDWTVSWEIDDGQGEVEGILLSFRSEIYGDTTCVQREILDPERTGQVTLAIGASCKSTIADGYVLAGMVNTRVKGKKVGDLVMVTLTVTAPPVTP